MIETGIICNFAKKNSDADGFKKKSRKNKKQIFSQTTWLDLLVVKPLVKTKKKKTMKIPIFPGKYYQNGGFSMAMLVYRRVGYIILH